MKFISVSPDVTEADATFMMKRVGLKEEDIVKALGEDYVLSVRPRDNYVVAMITTKTFPTAVGIAKRNPIDPFNVTIGSKLAMRRCFEEVKALL
jgi:hypothetical protein